MRLASLRRLLGREFRSVHFYIAFVTQINLVKHVVVLCVSPGLHHNALDANHFQFKTSSSWSLEWS